MDKPSLRLVKELREIQHLEGYSGRRLHQAMKDRGCTFGVAILNRWLGEKVQSISPDYQKEIRDFIANYRARQQEIAEDSSPYAPAVIMNRPELRAQISTAIMDAHMEYPQVARLSSMKPDTLRRLLRGELKNWFPANLAKVMNELGFDFEETNQYLTDHEVSLLEEHWPYMEAGGSPTSPVWVLSMAQAKDISDITEPILDRGWECQICPVQESDARDLIGFQIEGTSMSPKYQPGTWVLCHKTQPVTNRKYVVAKLAETGEVVCKQYIEIGSTVLLQSVNPQGEHYENPMIEWMVPVVFAVYKE